MDLKENINIPVLRDPDFDKQLNDPDLITKEIVFPFKKDFGKNISIFSLNFSANVNGNVKIFNDKEDKDDLDNYTEAPYPAIGVNNALLRYDLNSNLKEAVSGAFKAINLHFLSGQDILISCYKIHSNTKTLQQAILQDIVSLKTIFDENDIFSLSPNEGLAVKLIATLDAKVNLAFSDVFSWTLSQLVKSLPKGADVAGEASAAASLSFSVKINDRFKLFIQKSDGNLFKTTINKAVSHSSVGALSAGFIVGIDESEDSFTAFMDQIFSALLGESVEKVNKWVGNGLSKLSDTEKSLLEKSIDRIGIDIDLSDENLVKTRYEDFKSKMIEKAKFILGKKLELGVRFEYQKAVESSAIFQANITAQALKDNLKEILLFKLDKLEEKKGITVTNYIFSKKESISKKIGFRFSFGNFDAYWFNRKEFVFEESGNRLQGTYRKSFSGQRSHLEGGTNKKEWHFNLSGEMNRSVKNPQMDDFDYTAVVHWEDREKKTNKEELADFVEMGMKWDCINTSFDAACEDIYSEIKGKNNVKFICQIKIPSPEMIHLTAALAKSSTKDIINSLYASMPHFSNTQRKKLADLVVYFAVWKIYFENEGNGSSETWAALCNEQLSPLFPDLAKWEQSFEKGITTIPGEQSYQSFVGLTETNAIFDKIMSFQNGIKNLNDAIQNRKAYTGSFIKEIFNKMDNLVTSSGQNKTFNITFLGRYLLDIAQKSDLRENMLTKMTIEYENAQGEEKEIVYMANL